MNTIELYFYKKFILLKDMRARTRQNYATISCIGAEDGESIELYINGKKANNYIVSNGVITIPIEKNKMYRLASPNHPYGFKFNTLPANDDTDDILIFQYLHADPSEIKNVYRLLQSICESFDTQEEKVKSLFGYQTE